MLFENRYFIEHKHDEDKIISLRGSTTELFVKIAYLFFQTIFHLRNPEQAYYHLNRHSGIYKIGKVEDTMTVYEFHFILFRCSLTINVYYI